MPAEKETKTVRRISTGVSGLDEVLAGGLVASRAYLVRGGPGTGKSTLGWHFLTTGAAAGQNALYISLSESEKQLRDNAATMGFVYTGAFLDLSPSAEFFSQEQSYDIFSPADVERGPVTRRIVAEVERVKPGRVFVDSATQFRYLATDAFQFRKQMFALVRYLTEHGATVLMSSEASADAPDDDLQFLTDGVINLDQCVGKRAVSITKLRGSHFQGGYHSMRLGSRGMEVFPRLMPGEYSAKVSPEPLPFGIPDLDRLLQGGLERGTATIITGPPGVGKTSLGLQFMREAAGRGERAVVFTLEEWKESMFRRCEGIKMPVRDLIDSGKLSVVEFPPLLYRPTPDLLGHMVRQEVEERGAKFMMFDSTSGYLMYLDGQDLDSHLQALTRYLRNRGVTAILINEVESITGEFRATDSGISYIVDNIIFLRSVETEGELHRTIGVLKKRMSGFDKTLCEFEITKRGIRVGKPLTMGGILGGMGVMRSLLAGK